MKILFTRFPLESAFGGAEVQTLSLMRELKARGHEIAFLGSCPTLSHHCAEEGIPVTELDIGSPPVSKGAIMKFLWQKGRMRKRLIQAIEDLRRGLWTPDIVCMLSLSEKILVTDVLTEQKISVVWIEHDRVGPWLSHNPWLAQLRDLSKKATTAVVSDISKDIYKNLGWDATRLAAIPNGIDLSRLRSDSSAIAPLPEGRTLTVGCLSRLSAEKGVDVLVNAIRNLPEVTLKIVGVGREEGFLRTLIAEIEAREGMQRRIHIFPSVKNLADFYLSLDTLVLPSREHDPFGLVAAEAMTLGIPVIVTNVCGIASYLTHGKDALIVEPDSQTNLEEAIRKMEDVFVRDAVGNEGKKTAEQKFSLGRMVDAYEKVFTEARQH